MTACRDLPDAQVVAKYLLTLIHPIARKAAKEHRIDCGCVVCRCERVVFREQMRAPEHAEEGV